MNKLQKILLAATISSISTVPVYATLDALTSERNIVEAFQQVDYQECGLLSLGIVSGGLLIYRLDGDYMPE